MVVRVVTYGAESEDAFREWHRKRAAEVEDLHGLRRVEFIRRKSPPRAGAIMYFESAEDLRAYKESDRSTRLQRSMHRTWVEDGAPIRDLVYRTMELPDEPPREK